MSLLGIGHIVLDHLVRIASWPAPDSKLEASSGTEALGGPVARACITAARLGVGCTFAGSVGQDLVADLLEKELRASGVEPRLSRQEGRSARASIWVESQHGKRTVVLDRAKLTDLPGTELSALLEKKRSLLLLDGKEACGLEAAEKVRASGGKVLLDLGSARKDPFPLVKASDVLVVSKSFILAHFAENDMLESARKLREMGPRFVVITLGAGGAIANTDGESFWFPTWQPEAVVDTTGAGDIYHGVLAWSILRGDNPGRSLALAAVGAGMACAKLGSDIFLDPKKLDLEADCGTWPI